MKIERKQIAGLGLSTPTLATELVQLTRQVNPIASAHNLIGKQVDATVIQEQEGGQHSFGAALPATCQ